MTWNDQEKKEPWQQRRSNRSRFLASSILHLSLKETDWESLECCHLTSLLKFQEHAKKTAPVALRVCNQPINYIINLGSTPHPAVSSDSTFFASPINKPTNRLVRSYQPPNVPKALPRIFSEDISDDHDGLLHHIIHLTDGRWKLFQGKCTQGSKTKKKTPKPSCNLDTFIMFQLPYIPETTIANWKP